MYWTCKCGANVPSYEGNICAACRVARAKVVALVTIPEARDIERCHESAAQYYSIRVEPGVYPVELRITGKGEQYLAAVFSGIVTSSGYGAKRYENEIGKPGEVVYSPYRYALKSGAYCGGTVEITDAEALDAARGYVTV